MDSNDFFRIPVWYPVLAGRTFLTSFVKLSSEAIEALKNGEERGFRGSPVSEAIKLMRHPMASIPGNCFVTVDKCAPTDTERFEAKHGAVFSPESAWKFLARSAKVRASAERGEVEYVCIRPYRHMNRTREFRLFIKDGKLFAMSQYYLLRHFRRLEGVKDKFYDLARNFVGEIIWMLPVKTLVMDIYFTASDEILVIDLNPWGPPTNPLLLHTWDRDWEKPQGIVLMPPPMKISGEVRVSF
ncbi:MAG: hypothetical protein PHS41_01910 [Victivallaceae bacterium]|nr:hypothetical protein [Victivallaceae bacterium]